MPGTPRFGYTGQYTDDESDLMYMRARYYDPLTQQFLTRDPLPAQVGQPYVYANRNPVNYIDPTGTTAEDTEDTTELAGGARFAGEGLGAEGGAGSAEGAAAAEQASFSEVDSMAPVYEALINGQFRPRGWSKRGQTVTFPEGSDLAKDYSEGVERDQYSFPKFTRYAISRVRIRMKGNYTTDYDAADEAAKASGQEAMQPGITTWHHHEDRTTMELLPRALHFAVRHTGGVKIIERFGDLP